jgi:hypothetical protein
MDHGRILHVFLKSQQIFLLIIFIEPYTSGMQNDPVDFPDEMKTFRVHISDFNRLTQPQKNFLMQFETIEFYPGGRKHGKKIDKVKELIARNKERIRLQKKHKNKESNEECICVDIMIELMSRMILKDFRRIQISER